jgi:hypothetical protein
MNYILAVNLVVRQELCATLMLKLCSRYLHAWLFDTHQSVPVAVAVVWIEQTDGQIEQTDRTDRQTALPIPTSV